MKVAIDITPTMANVAGRVPGMYTRTGVGTYTYYLVRELLDLDCDNNYRLIALKGRGAIKPFAKRQNVQYRVVKVPPGRIYVPMVRKLKLPLAIDLFTGAADVFVFPNFVRYPLWFTKSSIVFVYDLSFLRFPAFATEKSKRYLASVVPSSVADADGVVTISQYSKRELVDEYGVEPAKVTVAEPGVDRRRYYPRADAEIAAVRQRYGLPERYVLYVGTIEPRKNVLGLLRAFGALPANVRRRYPLVLAGGRGWLEGGTTIEIEKLTMSGQAFTTGYVHDDDLPAMYTGASLFVFPSFYEGWGMPVTEAMACATPVITSQSSSLPEAAGDAALLIDPEDHDALACAIRRVLEDEVQRSEMVRKGLERVSRFSWRCSAERVLALIQDIGP